MPVPRATRAHVLAERAIAAMKPVAEHGPHDLAAARGGLRDRDGGLHGVAVLGGGHSSASGSMAVSGTSSTLTIMRPQTPS